MNHLTNFEQEIKDKWVENVHFAQIGKKTTVCLLELEGGFELIGSSAPVNEEDFEEELGRKNAEKDACEQLEDFDRFYRSVNG